MLTISAVTPHKQDMKKTVAIIGSGNWGSCIAKIAGGNTRTRDDFVDEVKMWVFEEMVDGRKLTEIINQDHENVKYLPGHKLPPNVVAVPDIVEAGKDADILVIVLPHQFLKRTCDSLRGHLKPGAYAVTLIKGVDTIEGKGMRLLSDMIREELKIDCAVLMGANLAPEVAQEMYCEATIGCRDLAKAEELKNLFSTPYFRLVTTQDEVTVELCGALKNIVAVGAGFCDGLGYGDNTKCAVIRLGLMEMMRFIQEFYGDRGVKESTFFESCGIADLVTTCYGGRNRRLAEYFVTKGKSIETLEAEMLNGQKLQGPPTAADVYLMLKAINKLDKYPILVAVHKILINEIPAKQFIDELRNHPEHM